jgi:Lipase (class 3)
VDTDIVSLLCVYDFFLYAQRVEASLGAIAKLSKSNPTPLVHTGFRKAYSSIRNSLIDVITTATSSGSSTPEQWHIYATGHSLGGNHHRMYVCFDVLGTATAMSCHLPVFKLTALVEEPIARATVQLL